MKMEQTDRVYTSFLNPTTGKRELGEIVELNRLAEDFILMKECFMRIFPSAKYTKRVI
jgi:hypothetical protein